MKMKLITFLLSALLFTGCGSITTQNSGVALATIAGLAATPELQAHPDYVPVADAVADALLGLTGGTLDGPMVTEIINSAIKDRGFTPSQVQFGILTVQALMSIWADENGAVALEIGSNKKFVTAFAHGLKSAVSASQLSSRSNEAAGIPEYLTNRYKQDK